VAPTPTPTPNEYSELNQSTLNTKSIPTYINGSNFLYSEELERMKAHQRQRRRKAKRTATYMGAERIYEQQRMQGYEDTDGLSQQTTQIFDTINTYNIKIRK
jgi:hypothetical protein